MEWLKDFLECYLKGQREEAYKIKKEQIPNRLFKFQPIEEARINSLIQNKIWFSTPKDLNDPYDCIGVHWDEEELSRYFKTTLPSDKLQYLSTNDIVHGALDSMRDHNRISCFSEELYNMPMWAHYASNHKGMCVEYNFSSLDGENDFSEQLFPVGYETDRYDITNLMRLSFQHPPDMRIYLLYFLMQIKHKSWAYEKEWRVMFNAEDKKSGLVECPIQPTAIYFGLNCEEAETISKRIKESFDCPMYKMVQINSKFYHLESLNL
ncbi:DUF2971 domain-containing protein [Paenibacillus barcinonensis]|uniref:DUF2971 domain-containing protein n=1 Tax=Paenibacillus barcinonensis TaxID=198119 RepID=A0A2V4V5V8_PAEBA|nr:DUF2971 domain-containing protein [Paenibacillus barcinonensis]PYE41502.1 hypothetical protein DFQ00_1701 [Paenibacillus barcinonensis]QKS59003.1 DUF2971 domain-containing protein [Paenibacillus barcinonensis]